MTQDHLDGSKTEQVWAEMTLAKNGRLILSIVIFFFFFSPTNLPQTAFSSLTHFFPFTFELSFILVFLAFSIWKYRICIQAMFLYSQKTSEEIGSISEKPPINPSATLPATVEDDPFGSRKARSSFGKGFFKIRGGKKTTSSPSLGECKRNDLRSWS